MAKIIKNGVTFVESANIKELPAKDITYNPTNGLTKLNVQDELDELGSKNTTINNNISNIKTEISVERSRINSFVALQDGSTTGDAELQDIRVMVDGTTAGSAGDAVRTQINDLNSKIKEMYNEIDINVFPNEYLNNTGFWNDGTLNTSKSGYIVCDYIPVKPGDVLAGISGSAGFDAMVYYNADKTIHSWVQYGVYYYGRIVPDGAYYVRFQTRLSDIASTEVYINPKNYTVTSVYGLKTILNRIGDGNKYTLFLKNGVYDIATVLTDDEINSAEYTDSGFVGIVVGDGVKLVGESVDGTIIKCELPTSYSVDKRGAISTLNFKGNMDIENLTVKSKNIRYPVHDDFTANINSIHRIKNCRFIADVNQNGEKTNGYGLGTRSGQTVVIEDSYIEPYFIYHNNVGFSNPSRVKLTNVEVKEKINLWDFNCEVDCFAEFNNVKCPLLSHSYNGTHNQTIQINGIGETPKIVRCDASVKYNLGNCEILRVHYGATAGQTVGHFVGDGITELNTVAPSSIFTGICLENTEADTFGIIQTSGIISSNKLGDTDISTWVRGTWLGINSNNKLVAVENKNSAIAQVILISDGVAYIKIL